MPACQLDHIAVTAPSLKVGIAWLEASLGAPLQAGGEHPRMGTHNALLRLGDSVYLEVIAVNPTAALPGDRAGLGWTRSHRMRPRGSRLDRTHARHPRVVGGLSRASRGNRANEPRDGELADHNSRRRQPAH